ncbi:hypothetical protein DFH29DRAFT_873434 [Suillus ampliporus]|nr:hypothetical protein DFH29DRAFT_873434 [Suillus ampliporus]
MPTTASAVAERSCRTDQVGNARSPGIVAGVLACNLQTKLCLSRVTWMKSATPTFLMLEGKAVMSISLSSKWLINHWLDGCHWQRLAVKFRFATFTMRLGTDHLLQECSFMEAGSPWVAERYHIMTVRLGLILSCKLFRALFYGGRSVPSLQGSPWVAECYHIMTVRLGLVLSCKPFRALFYGGSEAGSGIELQAMYLQGMLMRKHNAEK